ncbi:MAG: hypothetical protein MPN21_21805 [Thermoanaerobaculia bacterium]|nr:hypothetical protein [Thermoanaerobaculia bacterium]
MSTRLETLQVAKLAPQVLGDATSLVADFLRSRQTRDGGFGDRGDDRSSGDLYYTVFGLDALAAVGSEPRRPVRGFLETFDGGQELDLVHLGCLIRAWSAVEADPGEARREAWRRRLDDLRRDDGGWAAEPDVGHSSVYSTFVALGAHQDAGLELAEPAAVRAYLEARLDDAGGYEADAELTVATTPTTAAAVDALRQLGAEPSSRSIDWLRRRIHPQGGFLAADGAPMPDLLSTAVALHSLVGLGASITDLADLMLDYVDTLWTSRGAFHGHWADDEVDCEYTYYGLLALGHLSVAA